MVAQRPPRAVGGRIAERVGRVERPLESGQVLLVDGERGTQASRALLVRRSRARKRGFVPTQLGFEQVDAMLDGARGRDTPTYGPLVVPERTLLATVDRSRASCRVRPQPDAFTVDELRGASAAIAGLGAALVLAGVERLLPIYRGVTSHDPVMDGEVTGNPDRLTPEELHEQAWEIEDDRGNRYLGMNTGGWNGPDNGTHIAFAPGLDPRARQLRLAFPDPFGHAGSLTAAVAVPSHAA